MFQRGRKKPPYVAPSTAQDSCLHDSTTRSESVAINDGTIDEIGYTQVCF